MSEKAIDCMGSEINPGDWVAYPQNYGLPFSILYGLVHAVTKTGKPRLHLYGYVPPMESIIGSCEGNWSQQSIAPHTVHSVHRLWKLTEQQLPVGLVDFHKEKTSE